MATLSTKVVPGFEEVEGEPFRETLKRMDKAFDDLVDASQGKLTPGTVEGAVIRFQVADGYAFYFVEKEAPLTLAHIPIGDGYSIALAHIQGLTLEDVRALVESERRLAALLEKRRNASRERAEAAIRAFSGTSTPLVQGKLDYPRR